MRIHPPHIPSNNNYRDQSDTEPHSPGHCFCSALLASDIKKEMHGSCLEASRVLLLTWAVDYARATPIFYPPPHPHATHPADPSVAYVCVLCRITETNISDPGLCLPPCPTERWQRVFTGSVWWWKPWITRLSVVVRLCRLSCCCVHDW